MINITALHPFLRTKEETRQMIILLEKIEEDIFKNSFNLSDALKKNTPYKLQVAFERAISQEGNTDAQKIKEFFASVSEQISKLPTIHIMLAFRPKEEVVEMIHNWFFENYKQIVVVDFSTDESIIAGSVISSGGKAQDYTLATRIAQLNAGD